MLNNLNSSQSNFNRAFIPNQNLIPQRDTRNYGDLIHNNVNNDVLAEIITEYTLHIDGKDRDISAFSNPYKFIVSLGGPATRIEKGIEISGVPNPRIDKNFKNVKYIKLKYIMLPRHINYNVTEDIDGNKTYTISTIKSTILSNYRYLLVKINEISNDKLYSTNDVLKNECFVIYRDSNYLDAMSDLWFATQPVKIYYDNGLKNISRLSIEILTPDGDILALFSGTKDNKIPFDEINKEFDDSDFFINYNDSIQLSMEFEIGVCENQINSQKNYR
jgi:hypothetical protein